MYLTIRSSQHLKEERFITIIPLQAVTMHNNDDEEEEVPSSEGVLTELDYLAFVLNKCTSVEDLTLVDSRFKYSLIDQVTNVSLNKLSSDLSLIQYFYTSYLHLFPPSSI
jgi:hypothetical protein